MSPRPILLVEDDIALAETPAEQLEVGGDFAPAHAATAAQARAFLTAPDSRCDAVLLDIGLPDADGRDLCRALRSDGVAVPIIMLTGADAEQDVVRGLEAGANDYIRKPFRIAELTARLMAQLRVHDASDAAVHRIGSWEFRPSERALVDPASRRRQRLTDKETGIMKRLYQAAGRPVNRRDLLDSVWGYRDGVTTHTLETHIYRLRGKLEADPRRPMLLVTESGGYRLLTTAAAAVAA